ncbi:hypothetical protein [Pseudomonas putida]
MAYLQQLKKWGNKAVYFAAIGSSSNNPTSITSLSIANLKDKPLIIYEINVLFKKTHHYFRLEKFDPPLVIKGLEATSFIPEKYSELSINPNPFHDANLKIDIILITESSAIKCKPAKSPESIAYRHMKKYKSITVSRRKLNGKIYSKDTVFALVYMYEDSQKTSFLLRSGLICDDWPFQTNMLSREMMRDREAITEAINEIAIKNKVHINLVETL